MGGLGMEQFYWGRGLSSKEYKKFLSVTANSFGTHFKKRQITQAIANYDGVKLHNIRSAKLELIAM